MGTNLIFTVLGLFLVRRMGQEAASIRGGGGTSWRGRCALACAGHHARRLPDVRILDRLVGATFFRLFLLSIFATPPSSSWVTSPRISTATSTAD